MNYKNTITLIEEMDNLKNIKNSEAIRNLMIQLTNLFEAN